jgi:hypothetical protein
MAFQLTSPAFAAGADIPRKYTCDGEDVSPPLEWSGAPDDAPALALIVDDPDARGWIHWVVLDMDGVQSGGLPEGFSASPDAPPQGTNDFGRLGWGGPCPPSGTHRYRFTLFALDAAIELPGAPTAEDVRAAMDGHVIDQAELIASYTRAR